ncbi:MAG: peptidoglycan bridge formation glycyltransferase FemA/FemB family protein [Candidatus Magasanikbacteria bacterium]|nr:peptidoglycan bridge formation glycyltransferase FemA/FemB family protein [Candidatus Magasanikbacteria bacterium]
MGMEIKSCQNKLDWDNWALARKPVEFLQSWDWGEFQKSTGKDVLRLQMVENGRVIWQGHGFTHRLGPGMKYLYVPRVDVISNQSSPPEAGQPRAEVISERLLDFLKNVCFAFVRIESEKNYLLSPFGKLRAGSISYLSLPTQNRQPQNTLVLNINRIETELLVAMHEKTRYNIRLAEKKGVVIKSGKDAEVFWRLNLETIRRDKFRSHPKEYYKKMLEFDFCHQLTAYYQNEPIAAILLVVFGDAITYLHGVSGDKHRNLMAPYLLQWEGIKLGKELGCHNYDFGGIAPDAKTGAITCFNNFCWPANHPWTGITRFKVGFGGERRDYPGAVDVVLNKWRYGVYWIAVKLAKLTKFVK